MRVALLIGLLVLAAVPAKADEADVFDAIVLRRLGPIRTEAPSTTIRAPEPPSIDLLIPRLAFLRQYRGSRYLDYGEQAARGLIAHGEAALPALWTAMESDSFATRRNAAFALGHLSDDGARLLTYLEDPNPNVRYRVVEALTRMDYRDAAPRLLAHLRDFEATAYRRPVSAACIDALGSFEVKAAVPVMLGMLQGVDMNLALLGAALATEGETSGPATSICARDALLAAAPVDTAAYRELPGVLATAIVRNLGAIGEPKAVPVLMQMLRDRAYRPDDVLYDALSAIGGSDAIAGARQLLASDEPVLRERGMRLAGTLGAPALIPPLEAMVTDGPWDTRTEAALALARFPADAAFEPAFAHLLRIDDRMQSDRLAEVLREHHDTYPERLVTAARNTDPYTRSRVFRLLAEDPPAAARDLLIAALQEPDQQIQQAAVRALGRLGDPEVATFLLKRLDSAQEFVFYDTIVALGLLKAEAAIPRLARLAVADDPMGRKTALEALGHYDSDPALDAIIAALDHDEAREQALAALATSTSHRAVLPLLRHFDECPSWARQDLLRTLQQRHEALPGLLNTYILTEERHRFLAAECLGLQGREGAPTAIELLYHAKPLIRAAGAKAFHTLEAPEAVEALEALAEDVIPAVRLSAGYALWRQQPQRRDAIVARLLADAHQQVRSYGGTLLLQLPDGMHRAVRLAEDQELSVLLDGDGHRTLGHADASGATPLHIAVELGRLDAVRMMMNYGADPRQPNRDGETALDIARRTNNAAMVRLLEE